MSILIFIVVMLISLSLGAIGVGIYIANFRSKPENKNKNFSVATVSLIMVVSLFVGILSCLIIYALTYKPPALTCKDLPDALKGECCPKPPVCEKCMWGAQDIKNFENAQNTVDTLRAKADVIPRHLQVRADCDATVGCVGGGCCGIKPGNSPVNQGPIAEPYRERSRERSFSRSPGNSQSRSPGPRRQGNLNFLSK